MTNNPVDTELAAPGAVRGIARWGQGSARFSHVKAADKEKGARKEGTGQEGKDICLFCFPQISSDHSLV